MANSTRVAPDATSLFSPEPLVRLGLRAKPGEFAASDLAGARHIPLGRLCDSLARLPRDRPILAYGGHGERAATALSLLERSGFGGPLLNLDHGLGDWQAAGYPVALS